MTMRVFITAVLLALGLALPAAENPQFQTKDGVSIYYGLMPAQLLLPTLPRWSETHMNTQRAAAADSQHLVVALFDAASGQRIEHAAVQATLTPLGGRDEVKTLEPMTIAGTVTFGHFFTMAGELPFHLQLQIRLFNGQTKTIVADFTYRPPPR